MVAIANTISLKKPQRFNSTLSLLCSTEGASFYRDGRMDAEKQSANKKVEYALKEGVLQKPETCSLCNKEKLYIHAHHDDYTKPLTVRWLCAKCHKEFHCNREYNIDTQPTTFHKRPDVADRASIHINGKQYNLPPLKLESSKPSGLLVENRTLDEHKYFEEKYDWPALLRNLSYRERQVIKLRYAIGKKLEFTYEEIGRIFKVTRSRIQQIEAKALNKLRKLI